MDVKCEDSPNDGLPSTNLHLTDGSLVPEIGSTVVISDNHPECDYESPSKIWTGKRALCTFSATNTDLDDYPFHAVTYGEPGELYGLPYNDHNYAKLCDEDSNNDNQLALLAKVALSRKENGDIEIHRSDLPGNAGNLQGSPETASGSSYRGSTVPHVTIIKPPFLNPNYHTASLQPSIPGSTCKLATSNGRAILLTPNRGSLGASVQIHRVSSVNTSKVLLRNDFTSGDGNSFNGISTPTNGSIRCICGLNRDDGCLIQCTNCKVLQHTECMAPSSSLLPKPYFCELCHPRPVMIGEAFGLQRKKMGIPNTTTTIATKTIRLTSPATALRLPRSTVSTSSQVHNQTITPNRFFLSGGANGQSTASASLSVRPIQVRLGEVVGSSSTGATLYQVESATINQFSPRFINLDTSVTTRQQSQSSYMAIVGNQRSSKRKQDLFTLAGESASAFETMTSNYPYDESNVTGGQHVSVPSNNELTNTLSSTEGTDLPGPKFYRTPSQTMGSVIGLDTVEGTKPHSTLSLPAAFGEVTDDMPTVAALSSGVPEPASPDVVIWSDSYEKAAETRLSDALKQRIRNIFITPSERELRTLQMADSFVLSRGQQRCHVASFELGRKGLIATECIYPSQPIIEYKGYAMLIDEYSQQHDYKRHLSLPSASRIIPAGAELTLAFDFDYTACSYPVRCACGRGAPLCVVADWFRRNNQLSSRPHCRDYGDVDEKRRRAGGNDQGEDDYDFDVGGENENACYRYDRNPLSHRNRHQAFVEKATRNRIAIKRLLTPKRVSPAFSRVPYPSAKHMVQEQRRRHQTNVSGPLTLSKRGRGVRGARGCGRGRNGGGIVRQQQQQRSRASRPRGRPPSNGVKRNVGNPLLSSPRRRRSDVDAEELEGNKIPSTPTSSPPTDATEPGATSPWLYTRSPTSAPRAHHYLDGDINKKGSLRKEQQQIRQRRSSKMHSPRRTSRRSSSGPATSPFRSLEADSVFVEKSTEDLKPSGLAAPKAKRVRKVSGRLSSGVDGPSRVSEKNNSVAKRTRRQSGLEACDLSGMQGDRDSVKEQPLASRSNKSREDNWLAEVMRRIERMEKKRKKNSMEKKPKPEGMENESVESRFEMQSSKPHTPNVNESKRETELKEDASSKLDEEACKESSLASKKQIRKQTQSTPIETHASTTPLSREDRWMQWQIQRIAEMESSDVLPGGQQSQSTNGPSIRQRRRGSNGAKSLSRHSPQKKEKPDDDVGSARGEAECSLIVYKRRDQDPMAKFSRSRTGHHHRQQQNFSRSYSLMESYIEEDLPAGGELLDDHTCGVGINGSSNFNDVSGSNTVLSIGSYSPPKPSKKRWLSQALMEEDQQQQVLTGRATPSPEDSLTPPDSLFNPLSFPNQRALNPKKRIISQLEEAMALHRSPSSPDPPAVSPPDAPTPASKLPPKKRQSEEDGTNDKNRLDTLSKPKMEKIRMSLSEYRRRRGLSSASVESLGANKMQVLPPTMTPLPPATPPGSPFVDLKRLTLPSLPLVPATSGHPVGGPRTPSEPPSDDEGRVDASSPKLSIVPFQRSHHPPSSAPASLHSPKRGSVERFRNSFNIDSPEKLHASPPPHRPPSGGCDRHLSGHAQRRASPPPPPHLGSASNSTTPSLSPNAYNPSPVEHVLRRDREILQWQMERKHQHFQQSNARAQQSSHTSSSSTTHRCTNHPRPSSTSTPPQQSTSRSHPHSTLNSTPTSVPPTTAFNHHDMESIQETLRRKQEHLRAQLRDLQKAAASGSG